MPSFCQPCQQARAAPAFIARVNTLFEDVYCSACQISHAAVFFSTIERNKPSPSRKCIGHQGYLSACPHLQVSLAELQNLAPKAAGKFKYVTLRCRDRSCLVRAKIECSFLDIFTTISVRWSASLDRETIGTFWERCLAKLQKLHQASPEVFCSHLQTTGSRLYRPHPWNDSPALKTQCISCRQCNMYLSCDSEAENGWFSLVPRGQSAAICKSLTIDIEDINRMDASCWVDLLNPESYGRFRDQETKHIMWCDDRECITTFEGGYGKRLIAVSDARDLRGEGRLDLTDVERASRLANVREGWPQ